MSIGKDSSRNRRDHWRLFDRFRQRNGNTHISVCKLFGNAGIVLNHCMHIPLFDFPQFHRLVVGGEEQMGVIGTTTPGYPVDPLVDLQGFEVIEFGLVRLEFSVKLVLASRFLP